MKKVPFLTALFCVLSLVVHSQSSNPWKFILEKDVSAQSDRANAPNHYQTVKLDVTALKKTLGDAPVESFPGKKSNVKLMLPVPDGSFEEFYICESSVMHPDLAKQHPDIKSYLGTGVQNPSSYLRFDLTPQGFHAFVFAANGNTFYVEPSSANEKSRYISYYMSDAANTESDGLHQGGILRDKVPNPTAEKTMAGDCGVMRTYRLAVGATTQFTQFSGGTVTAALAAINTLVTFANGVFEKELHVRLILVPGETSVIFNDLNTDPFANNSGPGDLAVTNQNLCDDIFSISGYDIGFAVNKSVEKNDAINDHINSVCNESFKGSNVVSGADPGSALFREMLLENLGSQFGATHTMNGLNSDCAGQVVGGVTSAEPGDGSTIMGASTIISQNACTPGYQDHRDAYFHGINLTQLGTIIVAHTCPAIIQTGNAAPTVDAGPDRTFPKDTKFILNAIGTDDGNALTYCWEEIDLTNVSTMPPASTATAGPAFRSYPPVTSPNRRFPKSGNTSTLWEVLPTVGRTLKFRATARDNSALGGCTIEDDMNITVAGNAGPFHLISPNGSGYGGVSALSLPLCPTSNMTVTWDVANTNLAPVSCTNVDILLSTNSGIIYPITLASNTPNDGSEVINLAPFNITSPNCRVMVVSHWSGADPTRNVFFDDSDSDFAIDYAPVAFLNGSLTPAPMINFVCIKTNNSLRVVSPCNSTITMFPTVNPFPSYVSTSWNQFTGIFNFSFSQPGSFAVTFRVTTPTGFSDRVYVFYGNNCGGIGYADPGNSETAQQSDTYGNGLVEGILLNNLDPQDNYLDDLVKLYPNPSSSSAFLTIEIPNTQGESTVALYDMNGRLLKEMKTSEYVITTDLTGYAPGTYFVRVTSPFFKITKKFIIAD